jgi:hypothetical protein
MTRILKSILILALLAGVTTVVAKSGAWFTDQEKVLGNSIATGTIDIAVNGDNPYTLERQYSLKDLKPSQHGYFDETIKNVGSNPLNLYKTLDNFVETEFLQSEPKCVELKGTWTNGACLNAEIATPKDLASHINYDLRVELYNGDPTTVELKPVWWETIYLDSDAKKLGELGKTYLGMVPAGWYMKVSQSYHMVPQELTLDNAYQGEQLTFDMTFDAIQLTNTVPLENKAYVEGDLSHTLLGDDINGAFEYTVRDHNLIGTFTGKAPEANANYVLVVGSDPYFGGKTLGSAISGGSGLITIPVNLDLNSDLINAKVWLVLTSDWNVAGMTGWNPSNYLFETGLMDYYDADLP